MVFLIILIVGLVFLCRNCSRMADAKGYRGGIFGFLAAVMTIGFWFIGAVVGYIIMKDYYIYFGSFFAYGGAGIGALIAWIIANSLKNRVFEEPPRPMLPHVMPTPVSYSVPAPKEPVWCLKCGRKLPGDSKFCEKCGTKVPTLE
jgi:vacuolar-type H+-ATPase subunit I/STV1